MNKWRANIYLPCFVFTIANKNINISPRSCWRHTLPSVPQYNGYGYERSVKIDRSSQEEFTVRIIMYFIILVNLVPHVLYISKSFHTHMCRKALFCFLESWLWCVYQHTIAQVSGVGEKIGGTQKEEFCKDNGVQFWTYSPVVIHYFQKAKTRAHLGPNPAFHESP